MKSLPATACTAALFLSFSCMQASALAQQGPAVERKSGAPMMEGHHGMGGCGAMGRMGMMGAEYGALNLTRDQRNQIQAIHKDLRAKQFALKERMHDSMHSVTYYRDGKFDEQAARTAYATAEKIHRDMFENMLNAHKQVDALLTPQQRQQLSQASQ